MLRIVELGWLTVAAISLYEILMHWDVHHTRFYIFIATFTAGLFMFFFRRKRRLNYQKRHRVRSNTRTR